MKKLYMIKTENEYNQLLIFTSKKEAVAWAKRATRWSDAEIEQNIRTLNKNWHGCFDIFPNS